MDTFNKEQNKASELESNYGKLKSELFLCYIVASMEGLHETSLEAVLLRLLVNKMHSTQPHTKNQAENGATWGRYCRNTDSLKSK